MSTATVQDVQRYWDARPCNLRHSTAAVGTRQYFDEVEARKYFVEPHIPAFAEFAKWKGKRVLEIGCGDGRMTFLYAEQAREVLGVDVEEESIRDARAALPDRLADRVEFRVADAEALDVPRQRFDIAFLSWSL